MIRTKVLGEAAGIQWSGLQDRTETNSVTGLGAPLIVGQFRRGRIDKPMTITNSNIKAELGYDPTNKDYIAVQSMLDTGVPSVQVLRISDLWDVQYTLISTGEVIRIYHAGNIPANAYRGRKATVVELSAEEQAELTEDELEQYLWEMSFPIIDDRKDLIINKSVRHIGEWAFANWQNVGTVTLLSGGMVDEYAFVNMDGVIDISVDNVNTLGKSAFGAVTAINVTITNTLMIDEGAFGGSTIENLSIGKDSLIKTIVGIRAFSGSKIMNLKIKSSVDTLKSDSFSATGIGSISIDEGLRVIEGQTKIIISDTQFSILGGAFAGVSKLNENWEKVSTTNQEYDPVTEQWIRTFNYFDLTIPSSVEYIGVSAFPYSPIGNLKIIGNEKLILDVSCFAAGNFKSIVILQVDRIEHDAFGAAHNYLESFVIGHANVVDGAQFASGNGWVVNSIFDINVDDLSGNALPKAHNSLKHLRIKTKGSIKGGTVNYLRGLESLVIEAEGVIEPGGILMTRSDTATITAKGIENGGIESLITRMVDYPNLDARGWSGNSAKCWGTVELNVDYIGDGGCVNSSFYEINLNPNNPDKKDKLISIGNGAFIYGGVFKGIDWEVDTVGSGAFITASMGNTRLKVNESIGNAAFLGTYYMGDSLSISAPTLPERCIAMFNGGNLSSDKLDIIISAETIENQSYVWRSFSKTILDTVEIKDGAFIVQNFRNGLEFSNRLEYIGKGAFNTAYIYQPDGNFNIPKSTRKIDEAAFVTCNFYKENNDGQPIEIVIDGTQLEIENSAFVSSNPPVGSKVKIIADVKRVASHAFCNMYGITEFDLGEGWETIEPTTFAGIQNVSKWHIPANVKVIKSGAFQNNTGMTELTFDKGVEIIEAAFLAAGPDQGPNKLGIRQVIFPDSLKEFSASFEASALETVVLPRSLEKFYWGAYTSVGEIYSTMYSLAPSTLDTLFLRDGVKPTLMTIDVASISIKPNVLIYVTDIKQYYQDDQWNRFVPHMIQYQETDPDNWNMIPQVPEFNIPTDLEGWDIQYLDMIENKIIRVSFENGVIPAGYLAGNSILIDNLIINSTIVTIMPAAFAGHGEIKKVKFLGNNLLNIGSSAFAAAIRIRNLDIPSSVERIGSGAFAGMSFLETASISLSGYVSLDTSVFSGWPSSIETPENVLPDSPVFTTLTATIIEGTATYGDTAYIEREGAIIGSALVSEDGSFIIDLTQTEVEEGEDTPILIEGDIVDIYIRDIVSNKSKEVTVNVELN
ncbi:hypothetical protein GCM10023206_06780 [Acinetobacter puyangensis]|uniref:Leucine rich repeat-containing protein n=1 Tax=Acinetobacter puyangensis TaxID=1096779 RepID=A0A240E7M3_9GAMM|nr:leucine-rich repeat protein [Acinetobacter puyangensis]SNX44243.1 Leucine rich repeat-containing protein [Acinetobacter puyangensis]